jgi:hypothetical protein
LFKYKINFSLNNEIQWTILVILFELNLLPTVASEILSISHATIYIHSKLALKLKVDHEIMFFFRQILPNKVYRYNRFHGPLLPRVTQEFSSPNAAR